MRQIVSGVIRLYQIITPPALRGHCRFTPTCSAYAREAVGRFGVVRGGWLAVCRLARCAPWGGEGYDPVPQDRRLRP
ncbi:hypothetical protein FACS1894186_4190 [Alphaproteobacteria bacterium]|nr:hypothetical protein FACS1894186_4190 [Alphaproteobacteria bacterium]